MYIPSFLFPIKDTLEYEWEGYTKIEIFWSPIPFFIWYFWYKKFTNPTKELLIEYGNAQFYYGNTSEVLLTNRFGFEDGLDTYIGSKKLSNFFKNPLAFSFGVVFHIDPDRQVESPSIEKSTFEIIYEKSNNYDFYKSRVIEEISQLNPHYKDNFDFEDPVYYADKADENKGMYLECLMNIGDSLGIKFPDDFMFHKDDYSAKEIVFAIETIQKHLPTTTSS